MSRQRDVSPNLERARRRTWELLGIKRYIQAHTAFPEDPAVQQAAADLLADEGKFIDLAQSPIWIAQENVVIA